MKKIKNYIKPIVVLSLVLMLFSCGGGDSDDGPDGGDIPNPPRTAEDVIADFKALDIKTGINDLELESLVEGVYWKFRIIVPAGANSSNTRPMVLRLHGAARADSPEAHKSTACLVEPAFEGEDVFILSPNSNGELWYEPSNQAQVLALIDLTTNNLPIDKTKTVVMGYSDGGNGSWFFAQFFAQYFAASIPLASSYNTDNNASEDIQPLTIPLYVIHGSDDELFPVETTEGYVNASIDAGSSIKFVIADGLVHNEPCTYLDELEDAVDWLETDVWTD